MRSTPKFAHVVLQTSRLDEMRNWYCTLLDGHVVFEGHGLSFVTFDEEHHRIAFLSPPVPLADKSPGAAGMHHTAYPVGPSFLPELMVEALDNGAAPEELQTRNWALSTSPDLPNPLEALTR